MATAPRISDVLKPTREYLDKPLKQRIAEAAAKGDKEALTRLNLEAGTKSTLVGLATGLPDVAVAGYNWVAGKDVKDLRTRALEAANLPTTATDKENELAYDLPEYVSIAIGLNQLRKALTNGGRSLVQSRKFNKFMNDAVDAGDLTKADLGVLRKYALTGQGSDSPKINAALQRLRSSDKFSEIFATLDKAATNEALKGITPAASKLSQPDAAKSAVAAVSARMEGIIEAKNTAGNLEFSKARGLAGDKPIVKTDNILQAVSKLRAEMRAKDSDSARAVLKFLDGVEERITPTITAPSTAGTSVLRPGEAPRIIPGASGYSTTATDTKVVYDSLGMPRTIQTPRNIDVPSTPSTTIAGTPDTVLKIPGSSGYTTKASPRGFTVDETQALLREWGQKVGMDTSAIAGAGTDDIKRVYKTLFGSLSNDLSASAKAANAAGALDDQRAIQALIKGRNEVKKGYEAYAEAVAQGVPKWLQGKSISEVSFEDLMGTYKGLNPQQRAVFRGYLKDTDAEALKAIDSDVYQKFISGATKQLDDGTFGVDPAQLASSWKELSKDKNTVDALAQALGTNADEFGKRMNSLYAFTRKMEVSGSKPQAGMVEKLAPDVGRAVGTKFGYSAKQGVDLTADVWKKMSNGVSEDMLMKMLLSPEAKDFLKTSGMTKGSRNVLESLDTLNKANYTRPAFMLAPQVAKLGQPDELALPDDLSLPDDLMGDDLSIPDDLSLPPDLMDQQYPTENSMKGQVHYTKDFSFTPPTLSEVQESNPNVQLQELQRRLSLGVR